MDFWGFLTSIFAGKSGCSPYKNFKQSQQTIFHQITPDLFFKFSLLGITVSFSSLERATELVTELFCIIFTEEPIKPFSTPQKRPELENERISSYTPPLDIDPLSKKTGHSNPIFVYVCLINYIVLMLSLIHI